MTETTRKIILSGCCGVGKTSLVSRYVHQRFLEHYPSTLGVRIDRKELEIDGHILDMIIWDLASKSSQANVPQSYLLRAAGIIYVVDISEPVTFENMEDDIRFLQNKLPNIPIIIVANKSDLVTSNELEGLVNSMILKPHFVSSARDSVNVNEIFHHLGVVMLS